MKGLQRMTKAELIRRIRELERPAPAASKAPGDGHLLHQLQVHQVELEAQNQELRVARSSLEFSHDRYADLYDFAPVGYVTLDDQGVILELNLTAAKMFGRERTRMVGRPFHLHVVRDDLAALRGHLDALAQAEPPAAVELRLARAGAGALPVMMQSVRVYDFERKAHLCRTALTDLSLRRQAEAALRDSEERFRLLVAGVVDYAIFMLDADGRVASWNAGAQRIKGYAAEEILGRHCSVFYPPEDVAAGKVEQSLKAALREGHFEDEGWRLRKDGSRFFAQVALTPMRDPSGELRGFAKVTRDVTERRQTELALAENEARLRAILDTAVEGIITIGEHGLIESFNPAAEKLFGYAAAEVIGQNVSLLMPSPDREAHDGYLARYRETGERRVIGVGREVVGRRKDGSTFPIDLSVGEAQPGGRRTFTGIIRDLTKRKQAEAALHVSERSLRMLSLAVEQSPVSVLITEPSGEIIYVNPKFTEVTGYAPAEVLGKNPRLLKSGEQPPEFYRDLWATITAGRDWRGEFSNRKKNGELFWEYAVIAPIQDEHGVLTHFVAIKEDITARKRAEAALHASNRRMQQVLEVETVGVMFWDVATGVMVDANDTFLRVMGYSRHEVEARELTWQKLTPPEYMEMSRAELRKFAAIGRVGPYEKEYFHKDGSRQWFVFAGSALEDGTCVEFCVDISQRKRAEAALIEANEFGRQIIGGALAGIMVFDREGRVVVWNPFLEQLTGYGAAEVIGQRVGEVFPFLRDGHFHSLFDRALGGEVFDAADIPYDLPKTGKRGWTLARFAPWRNARQEIVGVIVAVRDITERRRLESELLDIADREQQRIGHDLHDGLGQQLTALEMGCFLHQENLKALGRTAPGAQLRKEAAKLGRDLRECIGLTRSLARGLAPVVLKTEGLTGALEHLARLTGRSGKVQCRFICRRPVTVADAQVAKHLYRIAQEAVNNALKHARARSICLTLARDPGQLRLQIKDDGRGLPRGRKGGAGMGLEIMRHRAHVIGAALKVESKPRQGVRITCTLPQDEP